ncbi:hypothetical protein ANO11243_092250 [Dothideomycetidae sp. 11243]|nr:hypothetical protein ANO11243_092250 [fungal sp. No.11243]
MSSMGRRWEDDDTCALQSYWTTASPRVEGIESPPGLSTSKPKNDAGESFSASGVEPCSDEGEGVRSLRTRPSALCSSATSHEMRSIWLFFVKRSHV